MKTKRKVAPRPMAAQVISLEAYRKARSGPAPAPREPDSVATAYCRWLALAGAVWAFWW
jgi:hypothetical protein